MIFHKKKSIKTNEVSWFSLYFINNETSADHQQPVFHSNFLLLSLLFPLPGDYLGRINGLRSNTSWSDAG